MKVAQEDLVQSQKKKRGRKRDGMGGGTAISGPSEPRDAAPTKITTNNTLYIAEVKPDSSITEQ